MSKYIKVIPLARIARMAIVIGGGRSLAQVKGDADYCMNGGFYDMTTGKPGFHLKAEGTVLATSPWGQWGFSWSGGGGLRLEALPAAERRNYIGAVELLTPMVGIGDAIPYGRDLGGKRGRTALGLDGDKLILYCSGDGTRDGATPEALQEELYTLGAETAIMLDGGGSSQCDFGGGAVIASGRRVHNYICVWMKKEEKPVGKKYTVCLDPGHGAETAGKCAPDKSYYEHEFNLDVAQRLKTLLKRHGVAVTLTRTDAHDVSLARRVQIANGITGLDLFVSIHSNASGDGSTWTSPDGYGIYTSVAGETAARNIAAGTLLARAKAAGVKLWGSGLFHSKDLYVLKKTVAPAILIEHGFHTNRAETALLKSDAYRQKLAVVDCKGILDYLGIQWQEEPAKEPEKPADAPWYAEDQKWVTDRGIADGTRPEATCTRAEVWAMLRRMKGSV